MTKDIIKLSTLVPSKEEILSDSDPLYSLDRDGVLMRLFGTIPDYTNPDLENIWNEAFDMEDDVLIKYCLDKGVDVIGSEGKPLSPWRDIAVMLMAVDRGIAKP